MSFEMRNSFPTSLPYPATFKRILEYKIINVCTRENTAVIAVKIVTYRAK